MAFSLSVKGGNMYIKKEDLVKILQGLLARREGKTCSRTSIIEAQVFKYVLNIVNTLKTYEGD